MIGFMYTSKHTSTYTYIDTVEAGEAGTEPEVETGEDDDAVKVYLSCYI